MKSHFVLKWVVLLISGLLLYGCDREEPAVTDDLPRPIKAYVVGGDVASETRRLPARVYASERAELSFRVPGLIVALPVKEGDEVTKGQLLAQLDQNDFKTAVQDKQAKYDLAKSNYERGKDLVKEGFISKMDFDKLESSFKTSKAALDQAKLDLSYTSLTALFDGQVAKRYVQNNEEIQAKQPIFALQNVGQLDIKFDLPETLVHRIRRRSEKGTEQSEPMVYAHFTEGGKPYALEFKEIATRADQQTRTFEATFTLEKPEGITVLPGMTATVDLNLAAIFGATELDIKIPNTAVFTDPDGSKLVWVIDPESMTVHRQGVETGHLVDDRILIVSGLKLGDRIVTAGVHHLEEGQKVRLFTGTFGE